jgi:hypothetical protein
MLQLWHRPWARLDGTARRYRILAGHAPSAAPLERAASWLFLDTPGPVRIGDRAEPGWAESWLGEGVIALPLPLRPTHALKLLAGGSALLLDATALPVRPDEEREPKDEAERRARALLDRVKTVWARLRDVEATLADPAQMWHRLQALWLDEAARADPEMDIIVRHARLLPPTLDLLDRAPRRVLRRINEMVPLARVQEVDRKAMIWLIRQPGATTAERAGDRQRIQAVAREESFNTLENCVVLSYARMAHAVARDYRDRHAAVPNAPRVARVVRFGGRCRTLERDLRARGVFEAGADATSNFVLQNDARYRAVWDAWRELLRRHRILDELWRWQARSWEEFCALVVVIALQSRPGARLVAASPIVFREEQQAGCWIDHVNPLAVLFLPDAGVTVEVAYRLRGGPVLSPFGAPIWLRLGRIDSDAFLSRWAIWPIWHADGGLEPGEAEEIAALLPHGRTEHVAGGITLRPVAEGAPAEEQRGPHAACFTIGTAGAALRDGIARLGQYLDDSVLRRAA